MENETYKKLWEDFLELGEKYQHHTCIHLFGFAMAQFVAKMVFDTAPSQEVAKKLLQEAIISGQEWSLREKEEE